MKKPWAPDGLASGSVEPHDASVAHLRNVVRGRPVTRGEFLAKIIVAGLEAFQLRRTVAEILVADLVEVEAARA